MFTRDPVSDELTEKKPSLHLVLLGNARSGKTTFRKRTRMLSGDDQLTEEEDAQAKQTILRNIVDSLTLLLQLASKKGHSMGEDTARIEGFIKATRRRIADLNITEEMIKEMKQIWSLQSIQKLWKMRSYEIQDSVEELIPSFARIKAGEATFEDYSLAYDR